MYKLQVKVNGLNDVISDRQYAELSGEHRAYYAYDGEDPEPKQGLTDEEAYQEHQDELNQGQKPYGQESDEDQESENNKE